MSNIVLITGGIKSGKSNLAEYFAKKEKKVTYVALSENRPNDISWQKRILDHKIRRPKSWKVIETDDLISVLNKNLGFLLIDSIGGFVVKCLNLSDIEWERDSSKLIKKLLSYKSKIIIVGEQAGWGLVSEYKIGNLYADRLGTILKEITKISKDNWLTINGKAIKLDNMFFDFTA
tara:strand:- start:953 stop:1480 length:528 start_codon:yes stop_codon:yes gene_type:complete